MSSLSRALLTVAVVLSHHAAASTPQPVSAWAPPAAGADSGAFWALQLESALDVPLSPVQRTPWPRFALERTELGGGFVWQRSLAALVRLEAVRSASPQSAFGIDRNSVMPRFRLAYASWSPRATLLGASVDASLRGGLIPEPWLERIEGAAQTRGLLALASERSGALSTSDVGLALDLRVADVLSLNVSFVNGEGKTEVEQNPGKNVQAILSATPLRLLLFDYQGALALHAGVRDGSVGVASARDQRALGAVTWSHPLFHLGAEAVYAIGLGGRADRELLITGAWGDVPIVPGWLHAVARGDHTRDLQVGAADAGASELLAGLFSDFGWSHGRAASELRRVRLYVTGAMRVASGSAAPAGAADAATSWRLLTTLEVTAASDVIDPPSARTAESTAESTAKSSTPGDPS